MMSYEIFIEAGILLLLAGMYYIWQKRRILFHDEIDIFEKSQDIFEQIRAKSSLENSNSLKNFEDILQSGNKMDLYNFLNDNNNESLFRDFHQELLNVRKQIEEHLKL